MGVLSVSGGEFRKKKVKLYEYEMDKDQKALYTLTVATLYQQTSHCHRRPKTTVMIVNWCIICEMRAMCYHITEKGGAQSVG